MNFREQKITGMEKAAEEEKFHVVFNSSASLSENICTKSEREASQDIPNSLKQRVLFSLCVKSITEKVELLGTAAIEILRVSILSLLHGMSCCIENHKAYVTHLMTSIYMVLGDIKLKTKQIYSIIVKWSILLGSITFLLSIFWLDSTLRGIRSFLSMRMSFFLCFFWCSIISMIALAGFTKFLILSIIAVLVLFIVGAPFAIPIAIISGAIFLWIYGSLWTTMSVAVIGALAFMLGKEHLSFFMVTMYSIFCAWSHTGWLGLILAMNLSFISSDALICIFVTIKDPLRSGDGGQNQSANLGKQHGFSEDIHSDDSSAQMGPSFSACRGPGEPSTTGTSDDEITRILNCTDHYAVLGFLRYENLDTSLLKREYRKRAMLVHPDKNISNNMAAEAFKRLQNAYEILHDSLKRKAYDDTLRSEELLNCFRRFRGTYKTRQNGFTPTGFSPAEAECEDPLAGSRQFACRKCSGVHLWRLSNKPKSRARWCQECGTFHSAKDGDGWVEQYSVPFFFGGFQKAGKPAAFVCSEGKIYDVTEWYHCQMQGKISLANSHRASFQVSTSRGKKNVGSKSASKEQSKEGMSEEEFLELVHNVMRTANECEQSGTNNNNSRGSQNRKKKRGKKL